MLNGETIKRRKPGTGIRDETRRQMDDLLISVWTSRFDSQDEHIAELTRTVRGFNGTPGLMQRFERVETLLIAMQQSLDDLATAAKLAAAPVTTTTTTTTILADDKPVTFNQIVGRMYNDFGKPILVAVVVYLLLTFMPQIVAHLGQP
jgi:hypothetical protein